MTAPVLPSVTGGSGLKLNRGGSMTTEIVLPSVTGGSGLKHVRRLTVVLIQRSPLRHGGERIETVLGCRTTPARIVLPSVTGGSGLKPFTGRSGWIGRVLPSVTGGSGLKPDRRPRLPPALVLPSVTGGSGLKQGEAEEALAQRRFSPPSRGGAD